MKVGPYSISEIRKSVVAFAGFVVVVLAALDPMHVLPPDWQPWVTLILAVAGNYGVFKVRNVKAPGEPVKPDVSEAEVGETPMGFIFTALVICILIVVLFKLLG